MARAFDHTQAFRPSCVRELHLRMAGALAGAVVLVLAGGCPGPYYPDTAFHCDPSADIRCPRSYYACCSDDPATGGGLLPAFYGEVDPAFGEPLFAGARNDAGRSGLCINEALHAGGDADVPDPCPVPCNPRWPDEAIAAVCAGDDPELQASVICCETQELSPEDCVLDGGCWRPATGNDVFDADVSGDWGDGPDPWGVETHRTHQDPGFSACTDLAGGDAAKREDCVRQLSVADQRGFCLVSSVEVPTCPLRDPEYVDACEQRNIDEGRACA